MTEYASKIAVNWLRKQHTTYSSLIFEIYDIFIVAITTSKCLIIVHIKNELV